MDAFKLNTEFNNLVDEYFEILIYGENNDKKKEHLKEISSILEDTFIKLYDFSKSNNFFWTFCSYRTYFNTYSKRLNEFLDKFDDAELKEKDFILQEQKRLNSKNHISSAKFIPSTLIEVIENENSKILKFLNGIDLNRITEATNTYEIREIEVVREIEIIKEVNTYPFTSIKAKKLFDEFSEKYKKEKNKFAHISFVYWSMINDKLIINACRPEMFKTIVNEPPYELGISHKSFKKLNDLNDLSRKIYYNELYQSIIKNK